MLRVSIPGIRKTHAFRRLGPPLGSSGALKKFSFPSTSFIFALVIALLVLPGCSANFKSIYRHQNVAEDASITTVDAKQRVILSARRDPASVRAFCSEPSPDVYSVVAQALSAGGALSKSADPATVEAALNLAFSDAEQGSTIPRTQTINMLRELMFRTCERYLNGAYDEFEMSIQAVRDQRLMVSILAIEQLTGAVTPKPVVIGASGTSTSGLTDAAIVRLDDALKARKAAEESHAKAEKAFNELNGEEKQCDAIAEAVKKGETLNDDQKAKQPKCDEARTTLASAQTLLTETTDHYSDLKRLASVAGVTASTAVSSTAPGGIDRAHDESIAAVAQTVERIVGMNHRNETEMMLFCWRALTGDEVNKFQPSAAASLQTSCLEYLDKRVQAERQDLIEEIKASQARMKEADKADFEQQWPALRQLIADGKKDDFIAALKGELIAPLHFKADCFADASSESEVFACFEALPASLKRDLPGVE